ncbi:hypothetical protein FLJC2902T_06250 [Flavobacterium limnosediminis JC2902]|uniref:Uncharacterized protein n=1 Tax=Flavobacterium limnosediminis JC2902 TaxID=1341181 RepID=V6SXW1_9FLAO|nr:hypothetical protein FLJC2902T_06250 [Flavobacterium limnosediminis JC2902]
MLNNLPEKHKFWFLFKNVLQSNHYIFIKPQKKEKTIFFIKT